MNNIILSFVAGAVYMYAGIKYKECLMRRTVKQIQDYDTYLYESETDDDIENKNKASHYLVQFGIDMIPIIWVFAIPADILTHYYFKL